ncbi:hypothetical protein AX16_000676 [Volvariella volvacea WC 439]|nr:hypothetical protein AX16_000676 [Volvariella volvacea WC 439]
MPNEGEVVLITGAGGWLGSVLARTILSDSKLYIPNARLILADVFRPRMPREMGGGSGVGSRVISVQANLTDPAQADALFNTSFGIPETIYCLHGIMSKGSEEDFDKGLQVNFDSVRYLLDATRRYRAANGDLIKFIFTSSLAVYGGPLPDVIKPDTTATPQGAYGMAKLTVELFVNEYTRRGFIDGRILRLPTIVVRPGPPAAAGSAFISAIIREPLQGNATTCPIGTSLDSPILSSLQIWVASPETTIRNLVIARTIPSSKFLPHTRVVCVPGFTTTLREELDALEKVIKDSHIEVGSTETAREIVQRLIQFNKEGEEDLISRRLVESWPARFDVDYALGLGFVRDEGGMEVVVRRFKEALGSTDE